MPNPIKERRNSLKRSPEMDEINIILAARRLSDVVEETEEKKPDTKVEKPSIFINAKHFDKGR